MLDTRPSDRRSKAPTVVSSSEEEAPSMAPQRVESREAIQAPATVNSGEPAPEEISALAYQLWVERGSPHGSHEQDWLRAENQLRKRQTLAKTAKV